MEAFQLTLARVLVAPAFLYHLEQPGPGAEPLTDREAAILRMLASQLSQREIGQELFVTLNTVKFHTRSIFRKLGVSTRAEAVARARELGLL